MNRRVVQLGVGRRLLLSPGLLGSSFSPAVTPRAVRPIFAATVTQPSRLASPINLLARYSSNFSSTFHNVAAADKKELWGGSPTSAASKLGLRRALHFHPRSQRWPRKPSIGKTTVAVTALQRRRLGSRRGLEPSNATTGGQKAAAAAERTKTTSGQIAVHQTVGSAASSKTLLDRLPSLHRPSKEELLAAASGFWHRLGIRFKWFSIRSMRPFNLDDVGAFLSWIFWGHVLWIVIGTTTFFSLLVLAINTVFAQETLAGWVGNYLTKSFGIKVVFESAIVPKWRDGVITFQNVFVSRRPGEEVKRGRAVSKGSSTTAAAAAAEKAKDSSHGNYTQFDVTLESVNVTLSFAKWFNGKGLLRDVEIHGVRGVIDRTHLIPTDEEIDPKTYRHEHNPGDFEIDSFKMEDVLLTVYQPKNFRPFTVSVFNCELPRLRKQWLFYDFMSANNMSGSFDDSLFTVHPRQVHGHTGMPVNNGAEEEGGEWKKHSRLRIDGFNIDHLNRGVEGPFSWIHEGNVDIVADVMIPNDADGIWTMVMSGIHDSIDRMEATVTNSQTYTQVQRSIGHKSKHDTTIHHSPEPASTAHPAEAASDGNGNEADSRFVVFDIRIQLNDVRASVPLFTKDLSYVNNALVRPIVAFINSRRAFIPVTCRVVKRQSEFDGSWTVFDSGLLNDVSRETYDAFALDVVDSQARKRRIKKVGLWTLQVAAQALFIGLAGQFA